MHDAGMRDTTKTITTLLTLPPDLVERDRVRRQALRAGAVHHPGLAPLRSAAFAPEGLTLTWDVPADSREFGPDDDAVAVLAPIASALAVLHDSGLAHGGVASDAVHVSSSQAGPTQVTSTRGSLAGWRPGGTPEGDVRAVVALLNSWLPSGSVGADIAHLLIAGADPDPSARPSMARLAAALEGAAARLSPPISPPAQRRARLDDAPPPRIAEPVAAAVPAHRAPEPTASARRARGRHAARRAPAGPTLSSAALVRVPWRWGVALAGAAAVAFLGLSALGSSGSAQEVCPAPAYSDSAPQAGAVD